MMRSPGASAWSPMSVGSMELDGILKTSMQKQRMTSAITKATTTASMFSFSQKPKLSSFSGPGLAAGSRPGNARRAELSESAPTAPAAQATQRKDGDPARTAQNADHSALK